MAVGGRSSVVRALQLKREAMSSIPGGFPGFSSLPAGSVTNVEGDEGSVVL